MKKVFLFLGTLIPWFITSIIPLNYKYYDKINKPFFAPPKLFYPIAWTIMYILIAITIYTIPNPIISLSTFLMLLPLIN